MFIQEINIVSALKVFSNKYQVFVNLEASSNDKIGIVSLVKKGIHVSDYIISENGRIIGLKVMSLQLWNVYPQSGSGFKKEREIFFRETLCNLMMNWKDNTSYIIESGDHNCTHRELDSLHNGKQHLQSGLVKHMQIHGLSDEFLNVHGNDAIMYSRITQSSKTRIDYVLSNTKLCSYFQYLGMNLGLDHCAMMARFDISLTVVKDFIPKDKFFPGWVISKSLEFDEIFLENSRLIFHRIKNDLENNSDHLLDPSFFWLKLKTAIVSLARKREKELIVLENNRIEFLRGFYSSALKDLQEGIDCIEELQMIKKDMNLVYLERSKRKVLKTKVTEIDDTFYDIHKLQNQRKYENQKKINEIKIGDNLFKGTENVLKAISEKMKSELQPHTNRDFDAPPTDAEEAFLLRLNPISLSEEEKLELLSPTDETEISYILKHEIDKDSSPGEDGITYRFISVFWNFSDYRYLFLKFLNFTRVEGSWGLLENFGVMTIKNKKQHSYLYEKKRKLTKVNKESNLGNGKVWTNRLKKIIIPKILPKTQFNCQHDVNIIDELREIRNVNNYLMGDDHSRQISGTILSIDFKDAFRSISHRWFNLVMMRLEIPQPFIDWFWMMYKDLYVLIVLNKFKSDKIYVERGFMEGHPPSMAAFVVSLIPMMHAIEDEISGIVTPDTKVHKIKLFADDLKCFLSNTNEVSVTYDVICSFETVSGLEMHRDPGRNKCQALPFGKHKSFKQWPFWVSVKDSIKIVGGWFSNNKSLEQINSEYVQQCFFDAYHRAWGVRGTIFQKAYYVNTFLLSKLWFSSQFIKLDEKMLNKILSKCLEFIYAGENEKPIRPLNFRHPSQGGIGLINPIIKAKALLVKNMYRDFLSCNGSIYDTTLIENIYGHTDAFKIIIDNGLSTSPVKAIYDFMIKEATHRNDSLIPSRNEKRSLNVKWGVVWNNLRSLKGLNSEEKCFSWKVSQDMLPVGNRIHRRNAERRCLTLLSAGVLCQEIQNLEHVFKLCKMVGDSYTVIIEILTKFLDRDVKYEDLVHFSFNHRNKKKLICALWFAVKMMFFIYHEKCNNIYQLLKDRIKELDWNLDLNRKIGSFAEMHILNNLLKDRIKV